MLEEAVNSLVKNVDGNYVDCTFGQGGHSKKILEAITAKGHLTSFDLDEIAQIEANKIPNKNFTFYKDNFKNISKYFSTDSLDGILIDCGVSSPQLDIAKRGFSFMRDGPLDMRFGKSIESTCEEIVNSYSSEQLAFIFKYLGEDKEAKRIANEIVNRRKVKKISSTKELSELIAGIKRESKKKNPSTKIFQALRMEVNQELENLKLCLESAKNLLKRDGHLVVISFHSLEDRVVKNLFKDKGLLHEKDLPFYGHQMKKNSFTLSKVKLPSSCEIDSNRRARSAKMRIIKKL